MSSRSPLRILWRVFGKPLYDRLFGRYLNAIIGRLNSALGQLNDVRLELSDVKHRLDELVRTQERLDNQMHGIAERHWDATAATRRLASIEDHLRANEQS